jgi:hypothetical protein
MLILDAANLQSRGSIKDERRFRKAFVRFVDNIKAEVGVDDDLAVSLAKQYVVVTDAVIDKNLLIEKKLNKTLLSFFDDSLLSKVQAYEYSTLDEEMQDMIAKGLVAAMEHGQVIFRDANAQTYENVKAKKRLEGTVAEHESKKIEIEDELKSVEEKIKNTDKSEDENELIKQKENLLKQNDAYKSSIQNAKQEAEKKTAAITGAIIHDEETISNEAWVLVDKGIKKLEGSVLSVNKKVMVSRIRALDMADKRNVMDRIDDCLNILNTIKQSVGEIPDENA